MQHHICPACKMPVLPGQPSYGKGGEAFHSMCGDPLGIKAAVRAERERCASIAERAFDIGTGHPFDEGVREGCRRAAEAIRNLKE